MFDIIAVCVFYGSLFQEHKNRVAEWSGWHPVFKYIVLWVNREMDCVDGLLPLWVLMAHYDIYKYDFYAAVVFVPTFALVTPVFLHHIYRIENRWGWCYLHSALLHFLWKKWHTFQATNLMTDVWLDNVENRSRHFDRIPGINLMYVPLLLHAWFVSTNTLIWEWCMPFDGIPDWVHWWPMIFIVMLITQINIVCENPQNTPRSIELFPAVRIFRGYSLHSFHFLRWDFFRKERMPWKFFNLMNLYRIFEFAPQERSCLASVADNCAATVSSDCYAQYLLAYTSDKYVWPNLKPMTEKGTYRYTNRCVCVYDMSY